MFRSLPINNHSIEKAEVFLLWVVAVQSNSVEFSQDIFSQTRNGVPKMKSLLLYLFNDFFHIKSSVNFNYSVTI